MECPKCKHELAALEVVRIVNPFRFKCGGCGASLSMGRSGALLGLGAVVLAAMIAGFALYMESTGVWQKRDSLTWFVTVGPLVCGLFLWLGMRGVTLGVNGGVAPARTDNPDEPEAR